MVNAICCIEDEAAVRATLQTVLGDQGEILNASTAQEAIEYLVHEPALFIIDLHLPGMNGLELTKLIRTIFPSAPILVMTALSRNKYEDKAMEMGATGFIEKPFDPDKLRDMVSNLLPRRPLMN